MTTHQQQPDENSGKTMSSVLTPSSIRRPSVIMSAAAGLLLLCPLTLRAQDFGSAMPGPMDQQPQVAIGQQVGPDGQVVNPDAATDAQSPDDSNDPNGDPNAASDDNESDNNSDDNASNDNDNNDNSGDNNGDEAQPGNDDDSSQQQQQQPDSNN